LILKAYRRTFADARCLRRTMGADWVDYIIADRTIIPPEHLRFYGERVVWDYEAIWRAHEDGRAPAAFAVEA
jgi:hypothetical protein